MHADEVEIDEALVRRLLAAQFPAWADRPLGRVELAGTVNAIFRLGDDLSVRLARRNGPTERARALDWLPRLSPLLPLEIPVPVAQGRPTVEYPWLWDVSTWVEGATAPVEAIDAVQAARDLAAFVAALQGADAEGAPPGRGVPLDDRDDGFRHWLARFPGDRAAVTDVWERALAAPPWEGPPLWHHGDLDVRNWLVRDGRICAVIDWDESGAGDPACDVMVAWKLHSREARDAFRRAMQPDDATWERARGWVVSQAVAALAYYTPVNNPILHGEAESWLELVLSEREQG